MKAKRQWINVEGGGSNRRKQKDADWFCGQTADAAKTARRPRRTEKPAGQKKESTKAEERA